MPNCVIHIDGAELPIDKFHFIDLYRNRGKRGRPSGPVNPPLVQVTRNPLFNSKAVVEWYKQRNGRDIKIEIKEEIDEQITSITVELSNAYIVRHSLGYDEHNEGKQVSEVFQMTAEKIKIEGVAFDWDWPS